VLEASGHGEQERSGRGAGEDSRGTGLAIDRHLLNRALGARARQEKRHKTACAGPRAGCLAPSPKGNAGESGRARGGKRRRGGGEQGKKGGQGEEEERGEGAGRSWAPPAQDGRRSAAHGPPADGAAWARGANCAGVLRGRKQRAQEAVAVAEQRPEAGVRGGAGGGLQAVLHVGLQALPGRPRDPEGPVGRRSRAAQFLVGPRLLERPGVGWPREVDRRVASVPRRLLPPGAVEEVEVAPHRGGEVLEHGQQRPLREVGRDVGDVQGARAIQAEAHMLCVLFLVGIPLLVLKLGHLEAGAELVRQESSVPRPPRSIFRMRRSSGPAPGLAAEDGGAGVVAGVVAARALLRTTFHGALGGVAAVLPVVHGVRALGARAAAARGLRAVLVGAPTGVLDVAPHGAAAARRPGGARRGPAAAAFFLRAGRPWQRLRLVLHDAPQALVARRGARRGALRLPPPLQRLLRLLLRLAQLLGGVREAAVLAVLAVVPEPAHLHLEEPVRRPQLHLAVGVPAGRVRAPALPGEGPTHAGVRQVGFVAYLLWVVGVRAPDSLVAHALLIEFTHVGFKQLERLLPSASARTTGPAHVRNFGDLPKYKRFGHLPTGRNGHSPCGGSSDPGPCSSRVAVRPSLA